MLYAIAMGQIKTNLPRRYGPVIVRGGCPGKEESVRKIFDTGRF